MPYRTRTATSRASKLCGTCVKQVTTLASSFRRGRFALKANPQLSVLQNWRGGIFELYPEFLDDSSEWANWIKRRRQQWNGEYAKLDSPQATQLSELLGLFNRDFQLPMAASLLCLRARDPADLELLIFLAQFTEHIDLTTLKHNGDLIWKRWRFFSDESPYDSLDQTMPEPQQYLTLVRNVVYLFHAKKIFSCSRLPSRKDCQGQ